MFFIRIIYYNNKQKKMQNMYMVCEIQIINNNLSRFIINKKIYKKQYIYVWHNRSHSKLLKQIGFLNNSFITLNHLDLLKRLLKYVNINKKNFNINIRNKKWQMNRHLLIFVSGYGHLEVVRFLLTDKRVDLSVDNNTAIRIASISGHLEIVRLLLADSRVDPNDDELKAIFGACLYGYPEIVRLLLADSRVDPSILNNMPIRLASKNRHYEIVKLLKADPRYHE